MCSRICSSRQEVEVLCAKLKMTPCPHCQKVGSLIRHGFLRGYDQEHQLHKTIRAARIFCSNRNRSTGCGRTFSVWMADKIRRLFLGADSLWAFLTQAAASNNKLAAFRKLNCGLSDSAPYRIWKRFCQAQTTIRTALTSLCPPPKTASDNPAQLTVAHLQKAFQEEHGLSPIAAFQATLQSFFM